MKYITTAQLIAAFTEQELIQLTDHDNIGIIDQVNLDEAVVKAEVRVDGYISPRYSLPLAQSLIDGSSLSEMCGYIVRRILYRDNATDQVKEDAKVAVSWLKDVQAGRVSLGSQDSEAVDTGRVIHKTGKSGFNWTGY